MGDAGATKLRTGVLTALWALTATLTIVGLLAGGQETMLIESLLIAVLLVGTTSLGVLIVVRTGNVIGWLFCLAGVYYAWSLWAEATDGGLIRDWLVGVVYWFGLLIIPSVVLLFPDGRLPSSKWRRITWLGLGGAAMSAFSTFFASTVYPTDVEAPLAGIVPGPILEVIAVVGVILLFLFVAAALIAPILRYRRAGTDSRLQIRLFVLGATVALLGVVAFQVLWEDLDSRIPAVVTLLALPISVTVAILRYRLYDIDRMISRTLSYAVVVGLLAAVFAVMAIGLPRLFRVPDENQFLVAGATLAVAALFNPLRRRVQGRVDRRFNRARYDAQREVELFSDRLRDEVKLDDVSNDLVAVAAKTMQPESAGVWVREAHR